MLNEELLEEAVNDAGPTGSVMNVKRGKSAMDF
jgi:hypothetical protein